MIKWLKRALLVLLVLLLGAIGTLLWNAQRSERPVGFEYASATDARGRVFPLAIWYPTRDTPRPTTLLGLTVLNVAPEAVVDGQGLPLVVISHGNLGGPGSHADLAMALADAGYVVAAPMHSGDNYRDGSGLAEPGFWSGRNRQLQATIDHMTTRWRGRERIDATRIGAFGFSAGGFTVLTAIGAQADLARVRSHCARASEFACTALKDAGSPLIDGRLSQNEQDFFVDSRIRAAVVAAPGLGFSFGEGFDAVRVPVQLWSGSRDRTVPDATNTKRVRDGLGARVEAHVVAGAGHMSFLMPCALFGPPALCRDEDGFDRVAFHRTMNADVRRFFDRALKP